MEMKQERSKQRLNGVNDDDDGGGGEAMILHL
jgi:hypothetical protein